MIEAKHCDDYIGDYKAPKVLRWFLLINRLSATDNMLAREFGAVPTLFADHNGKRVRVVMASRLGDVGITYDLNDADVYERRVAVESLTNFSDKP